MSDRDAHFASWRRDVEAEWCEPRNFDGGKVPAASFDEQGLERRAEEVILGHLDAGVAAAMEDEVRVLPEQA